MYVLLREENDYNQYGEYFVAAWNRKPTPEEISKVTSIPVDAEWNDKNIIDCIVNNSGNPTQNYTWYSLVEYTEGERY